MGSDNKVKIGIMAGVLALLIVAFVMFMSFHGGSSESPTNPPPNNPSASRPTPSQPTAARPAQPGMPPHAGAPTATVPPHAVPPAPGQHPAVAMTPPKPTPPPPPVGLQPPSRPTAITPKPLSTAGLFDPFQGGPPPYRAPKPPKIPDLALVMTVPSVTPQRDRYRTPGSVTATATHPLPPPAGRLAGWIYNNNGQIVAIFEDADGISHSVHVGDQVGNLTVKSITQDTLVMVDQDQNEQQLKLQGLENYTGKSRTTTIDATPSPMAPTWGAH